MAWLTPAAGLAMRKIPRDMLICDMGTSRQIYVDGVMMSCCETGKLFFHDALLQVPLWNEIPKKHAKKRRASQRAGTAGRCGASAGRAKKPRGHTEK
jgi:hypothetical protein